MTAAAAAVRVITPDCCSPQARSSQPPDSGRTAPWRRSGTPRSAGPSAAPRRRPPQPRRPRCGSSRGAPPTRRRPRSLPRPRPSPSGQQPAAQRAPCGHSRIASPSSVNELPLWPGRNRPRPHAALSTARLDATAPVSPGREALRRVLRPAPHDARSLRRSGAFLRLQQLVCRRERDGRFLRSPARRAGGEPRTPAIKINSPLSSSLFEDPQPPGTGGPGAAPGRACSPGNALPAARSAPSSSASRSGSKLPARARPTTDRQAGRRSSGHFSGACRSDATKNENMFYARRRGGPRAGRVQSAERRRSRRRCGARTGGASARGCGRRLGSRRKLRSPNSTTSVAPSAGRGARGGG